MDEYGYHLLPCQFNEGRRPRHGAINDIICRALKSAGLASIMEPVGLSRDDRKKPDGISIFPFNNGKALCWDATCVNTFSESAVNGAAVEAGHTASKAENTKRTKYPNLVRNYRFELLQLKLLVCLVHQPKK